MCFLGLCNVGQAICNLIFIIQKSVSFEGPCNHTHSFVSVANTGGTFHGARWACWPVNQVDNLHSSSCLPIQIPQSHPPSGSTSSSEFHLPSLLPISLVKWSILFYPILIPFGHLPIPRTHTIWDPQLPNVHTWQGLRSHPNSHHTLLSSREANRQLTQ